MSQKITKYEKIIFMEREIENNELLLKTWKEYAEGKRDIHAESKYIFVHAKEKIGRIEGLISSNSLAYMDELFIIIDDFYDSHYYDYDSAIRCASDFLENYEKIINDEAQKEYNKKIKYYGIYNAKKECKRLRLALVQNKTALRLMMNDLNLLEKMRLKHIRNSPTARINCSPSFISCYKGGLIFDGFITGIKEGGM